MSMSPKFLFRENEQGEKSPGINFFNINRFFELMSKD